MAAGVSKMRRSLRAGRFGRRSEEFVAKDHVEVEWHRLTRLAKFELGLSAAGLNPSGASIREAYLCQRGRKTRVGCRSVRGVKVGYVVKRYPRYSETFIVNEILAHEAAGMEIEIFSVLPPEDGHFQDVISRVRAPHERPPRIVGVGRLVEKKGFVDLIDACAINSLPPAPRVEAWPAREEGV